MSAGCLFVCMFGISINFYPWNGYWVVLQKKSFTFDGKKEDFWVFNLFCKCDIHYSIFVWTSTLLPPLLRGYWESKVASSLGAWSWSGKDFICQLATLMLIAFSLPAVWGHKLNSGSISDFTLHIRVASFCAHGYVCCFSESGMRHFELLTYMWRRVIVVDRFPMNFIQSLWKLIYMEKIR